jgi:hypothetical protein
MFIPPLVRPIRRRDPLLTRRLNAMRCAFRKVASTMRIVGSAPAAASPHHANQTAHLIPASPAMVERLMPTIVYRCATPSQSVSIDENDATQHLAVINPRPPMAVRKIRPQARHLFICQPVQVVHSRFSPLSLSQVAPLTSVEVLTLGNGSRHGEGYHRR